MDLNRLERADQLRLEGEYDDAAAIYKRLLATWPGDPLEYRARHGWGLCLVFTGWFDEAIAELERVRDLAPDYRSGRQDLFKTYLLVGLNAAAEAEWQYLRRCDDRDRLGSDMAGSDRPAANRATGSTMAVTDFSRSWITFTTFGRTNQARIQVESRCLLRQPGGQTDEYWLVASCKAEDTYGVGELFRQPNYDFSMLYTRERYRIDRIGATTDPSLCESGWIRDRFETVAFDLRQVAAELLTDGAAIGAATLAGRPLVAETVLRHERGAEALLQYPVKTMNVRPAEALWQVDTGPLALPQGRGWAGDLDGFEIAFAAFRTADWVEFILRRPLGVAGGASVDHYHAGLRLPAVNRLWALP